MNSLKWSKASLGSLCSPRKELVNPSDGEALPYVGLEHLDPGRNQIKRWGSIEEVRSTKSRFHKNDVLYGKLRPYLDKAALAEWIGVCSTDILVLTPNEELADPVFLSFLLHTHDFINHAVSTTEGVNHPRTSWTSIAKFLNPTPPLPEQRVIAAVLAKVQAGIETQRRIVATLKELKAATMAKLFREGTRAANRDTASRYGEFPANWEQLTLDRCAFVQTGIAKGRRLNGSDVVEKPYLRVANVQDGYLDLNEIKTIQLRESEVERFSLRYGDVLLTEGGDFDKLGRGFIWRDQVKNCVHQNHIFAVRTDSSRLLSEFFTYLIQSPYGKAYFLSVAHKTTNLACINTTKLRSFPVIVPPIDEQHEIAEVLGLIDKKIEIQNQVLSGTQTLFTAMLHLLMTGEIRVTPQMIEEARHVS
ncbi:MAG: restriction endonuclease subunit S [Deltaproteobacteria bacterium]|nr:restriction endonuclease subunit S [Deltaproteobacteria bacterium]